MLNRIKNKKINYREAGITLVALVVTIIVLLILAGITMYFLLGQNGVLERAQYSSNTWSNATKDEEIEMASFSNEVDELTQGFIKRGGEEKLTPSQIAAINSHSALQTVAYVPATTNEEVTVAADYNGGMATQIFTQSVSDAENGKYSLGALGLSWYVLNADENGVNLVSDVTTDIIEFKGASAYDNCLYFLNEIGKKLFANESLGVTADRVHPIRLSDLKEAAKSINGWSENDWKTNFIDNATAKISDEPVTLSNAYCPQIYMGESSEIIVDNPMYDENPGGDGVPVINDELSTSQRLTSLTVNGTGFYYNNSNDEDFRTYLGEFGSTGVANKLFEENGNTYWLASRCIKIANSIASYSLYFANDNQINLNFFCNSKLRTKYAVANYMRFVVSVPASMLNIANDGTVTLKV